MAGSAPGKAYAAASEAAHQNEFDRLKQLSVIRVKNGETVPLVSVFQVGHSSIVERNFTALFMYVQCLLMLPSRCSYHHSTYDHVALQNYGPQHVCLLPFLTHFADLSSWEYAKKLKAIIPQIEAAGTQASCLTYPCTVVVIGLGSRQNALSFSKLLNFPLRLLYADPEGVCYKALGFSPGFAPDAPVSAYLKLLPMLAGIGSPGTIQEVLRGYIGDRSSKPVWDGNVAFNILGKGYQRPFELATLRLNHMVNILPRWAALCPANTALLTQQGGTLIFEDEHTAFRQDDTGILKYTNIADLTTALARLQQNPIATTSQI
ncbi:MAG: hypothetical protein FRX49_00643 [Trebouxia sp. A1-2]|nr:MAG: hypothetical protein FRX49_00643 [Trebouxia sp. A1-2]